MAQFTLRKFSMITKLSPQQTLGPHLRAQPILPFKYRVRSVATRLLAFLTSSLSSSQSLHSRQPGWHFLLFPPNFTTIRLLHSLSTHVAVERQIRKSFEVSFSMSVTSPDSIVTSDANGTPPGVIMTTSGEECVAVVPAWLTLPPEIWERIASFMLPQIRPEDRVYPQIGHQASSRRAESSLTSRKGLLGLALTCKQLTDIALQALYQQPYLSSKKKVNEFVETICQNDRGVLVPETCQSARWIRALHIMGEVDDRNLMDTFSKRFCTCDIHVLLCYAANVRFLSLNCDNTTNGDWWDRDEIDDHLIVHFLSTTTKCRPRALRYSADFYLPRMSLARATSFAPLSQLTHLELVKSAPTQDLTAFLAGAPHLAPSTPGVEAAISAGLSPNSKLECVRFSETPRGTLQEFAEFMAFRARPVHPLDVDEVTEAQHALYDLAINSSNLPNLRLLLIDANQGLISPPIDLLKRYVKNGLLKDVSKDLPPAANGKHKVASSSLSPLFSTNGLNKASEVSLGAGSQDTELNKLEAAWQRDVRLADEHWQRVHQGKHDLMKLWNGNRAKCGLQPTEIRVVTSRVTSEEDFYCQARSFDPANTDGSSTRSGSNHPTSYDVGIWADPDVFSLADSHPWLGYWELPEYGCCCWNSDLPRDSNPNAIPSEAGGETKRTISPSIIKIDLEALDQETLTSYGRDKRRARESQGSNKAESKRRRTRSTTAREAGLSTV